MNSSTTKSSDSKWKFIDLFCGMGSFHYSFTKLGNNFECVAASDIYKPSVEFYKARYNLKPHGNICDIDPTTLPSYDIVCAGFPCQPFSQAGLQKGFKDKTRGTMFDQVMRIATKGKQKAKIIILENVSALLNHDKGRSFKRIQNMLSKEGYKMVHKILTCSDYGIPQKRKRLFILAFDDSQLKVTDADKFFDLDSYKKDSNLTTFLGHTQFEKKYAYTLRCGGRRSPINDRHNWDGYYTRSPTSNATASYDTEYRLTIDDAMKLQGFDNIKMLPNAKIGHQWKLLGNTIPTVFTKIIGLQILKHFKKN